MGKTRRRRTLEISGSYRSCLARPGVDRSALGERQEFTIDCDVLAGPTVATRCASSRRGGWVALSSRGKQTHEGR